MKKPLLFSLFVWLLLFVLPWTRGYAWLDWKSATLERLSGIHPAWAPLDPLYQPEKQAMLQYTYYPSGAVEGVNGLMEERVKDVRANGFQVPPQFAALTRSNDRDVLVWCARSATEPKAVTRNLVALSRRFPSDASVLAWACGAQMNELSLSTRLPGPLSNYQPGWSVQSPNPPTAASPTNPTFSIANNIRIEYGLRPRWDALAVEARRGEQMEPNNGFWWWLETTCLLGARRDEAVWKVLKTGSQKTAYEDHDKESLLSLRRAHLQLEGVVPVIFYLQNTDTSWMTHSQWRTAARQVCENTIGKRLQGEHKTALEGGRDLVFMGSVLQHSTNSLVRLTGTNIEAISLQSALPYSLFTAKYLKPGFSAQALASHPRSLLRYANQQGRKDIARQLISEWNVISQIRRKSMAVLSSPSPSGGAGGTIMGANDQLTSLVAGLQNVGRMLVQTLPIPLLALAVLSLLTRVARQRDEPFSLPKWTQGLGWSAFALLVLFGAQVIFTTLAWNFVSRNFSGPMFWGFYMGTLPRLVALLPIWAFAFPAYVAGVGALWGVVFAARRGRGDLSTWERLKRLFTAPDDRVGVVNLEPLVQIVALAGIWGASMVILGLWFYLPQESVLDNRSSDTLHAQSAGLFLWGFVFMAVVPALFFRTGRTGFRVYSWSWLQVARRFLVAHIALTTTLYLLLATANLFSAARFETEWQKANVPPSLALGQK